MCSSDKRNPNAGQRYQQQLRKRRSLWAAGFVLALASWPFAAVCRADSFVKPTEEELKMTSLPGYPGAPAVVLNREEITKDDLHAVEHYDRIKILTEDGKKYANVELGFISTTGWSVAYADDKTIDTISGRTIHPDGTIIPFTGKPYLKVLEKVGGVKLQEKVFTLPDVEVGSIIEYRYVTRINDTTVEAPTWMVQDDLYVKQAHFVWYPTAEQLHNEDDKIINTINWFPVLPAGATIQRRELQQTMGGGMKVGNQMFELSVKDVPPRVKEDFMPPLKSFSYRVMFNFTPYRTPQEFWTAEGKRWSKRVDKFIAVNGDLTQATQKIIAGANTPQEKLERIYATVMGLENTEFTRERESREDKAAGMGQINHVSDVLTHGRGTPRELTELFIGMSRAAGLQAYAMLVPDRSEDIFVPEWLSFQQLRDMVAIVMVDGKEMYFDPGQRYCQFGQLAWQHTFISGLRQTEGGTALARTTGDGYKANRTTRVANLDMDAHGEVTGKITLSFEGAPALRWRHVALRGDEEGLNKGLREALEAMLPKSLNVKVSDVKNVADYTKPLVVSYAVTGVLASGSGKRMIVPPDLFLASESATFPHEKREMAVDFHYPTLTQDAVKINLPQQLTVEAAPNSAKFRMKDAAAYSLAITPAATSVTTRRDFVFADVIVLVKDYPDLRSFYSQFESKDQESIVLKAAPATTASAAQPQGN